jgi:hypothetical protein
VDRVRADWQALADAVTPRTQAFVDGAFRDARSGRTEPTVGRDLSLHALDKYTGLKTTWIRY